MDGKICGNPKDANSPVWCTEHKMSADKVWESPDRRLLEYKSKYDEPEVIIPHEQYL